MIIERQQMAENFATYFRDAGLTEQADWIVGNPALVINSLFLLVIIMVTAISVVWLIEMRRHRSGR